MVSEWVLERSTFANSNGLLWQASGSKTRRWAYSSPPRWTCKGMRSSRKKVEKKYICFHHMNKAVKTTDCSKSAAVMRHGQIGSVSTRKSQRCQKFQSGSPKLDSSYLDEVVGPSNDLRRVTHGFETIELFSICLDFVPYLRRNIKNTVTKIMHLNSTHWTERAARVETWFFYLLGHIFFECFRQRP